MDRNWILRCELVTGMEQEKEKEWLQSAEGFFSRGDLQSMRACGRQLLEEDPQNAEGLALVAEASVYMQDFDTAEEYLDQFWSLKSQQNAADAKLRGLLASAAFYGAQYMLDKAMPAYEQLFKRYKAGVRQSLSAGVVSASRQQGMQGRTQATALLNRLQTQRNRTVLSKPENPVDRAQALQRKRLYADDGSINVSYRGDTRSRVISGTGLGSVAATGMRGWSDIDRLVIMRGYSFYADTCLLAGCTEKAAEAAFMVSSLLEDKAKKASYFSKGLFLSNYREADSAALATKHRQYGQMLEEPVCFHHDVSKRRQPHALRIGYISPDFRLHAAAYFFTALLHMGDHTNFAVYAYSTGAPDHITQRFMKMADKWRDVHGKKPQEIAQQIYNDHIDILVDLSGHSQNNCLPVLACRPAPVQMSAIGYINTTGLPAVDYFLTDQHCVPAGDRNHGFSEKLLRLEHCHLCYTPETMRTLKSEGHNAPAMENGYVTFGSFNSFAKVSDQMLLSWRNILANVPNSKLVIKCKICSIPSGQQMVRERFSRLGGDASRLELRPFSPDYLMQYKDIDIVLDTAPYNGGLTTCDALYMGVPVIVLKGRTHGSRYGVSILQGVGLPELIADNQRDYVAKATQLANNGMVLNRLHKELPEMMRNSRLMDGRAYMRELEEGYAAIWERYCWQ